MLRIYRFTSCFFKTLVKAFVRKNLMGNDVIINRYHVDFEVIGNLMQVPKKRVIMLDSLSQGSRCFYLNALDFDLFQPTSTTQ